MNTSKALLVTIAVSAYALSGMGCGNGVVDDETTTTQRAALTGLPVSPLAPGFYTSVSTSDGEGKHAAVAQGGGNGSGIVGQGVYGGVFTGYASGVAGIGGAGYPGGEFYAGTSSTPQYHQPALALKNGNLTMEGVANPLPQVPFRNTLTPANIVKAWGVIESGGAGAYSGTVVSGFNLAGVDIAAFDLEIRLAQHVADGCAATVTPVDVPMMCMAQCSGLMVVVKCYRVQTNGTLARYNFGGEAPTRLSLNVNGVQ